LGIEYELDLHFIGLSERLLGSATRFGERLDRSLVRRGKLAFVEPKPGDEFLGSGRKRITDAGNDGYT
jgi:hypothetical protein